MLKNNILISLLAVALFCTGCIKEGLENCPTGLRLKFTFTLHTNEGNMFGPDVQQVRVYLFDADGILRYMQEEKGPALTNDYAMDLQVAPGTYTIIAWGGSYEDFYNSFHEGHMNDPLTHDYENGVTIGKTTLADFRIFINYGIADNYPEDLLPVINEFDDLYYGAAGVRKAGTSRYEFERVQVLPDISMEREIELIRNTNILKVSITGLQYLHRNVPKLFSEPTDSVRPYTDYFSIWASARNGRYKYDNAIGEYARMLRYHPYYTFSGADTLLADIKLLRLDMERHTAESVYLYIEDIETGIRYPSNPIDVVNTLLQARDPVTGNYIYGSQEDFDRIYEHPIELRFSQSAGGSLKLTLIIAGWERTDVVPIL